MKSTTRELLKIAKELNSREEFGLSYDVLDASKLKVAEDVPLGKWTKRLSTLIGMMMGLSHGAIEASFLTLARIINPARWNKPHAEVGGSLIAYAREISRAFGNLSSAIRSKATLHMKRGLDPGQISEKIYDLIDKLFVKQAHSVGAFLGALLVITAVSYLLIKIMLKINKKVAQGLKLLASWATGKDIDEVGERVKRFFLSLPARAKAELLFGLTVLGAKLRGKESTMQPAR